MLLKTFNVSNLMSLTNETKLIEWHETCNVNVDQMQVSVIIKNVGIMINADVNVKSRLIMEDVIKDLFGTKVIVNVSVINHVILENIQIMQIVRIEND